MLSLSAAKTIVEAALAHAATGKFKPLAVVVFDARGAEKALLAQDGTSLKRADIAKGKALGALGMGVGSRGLMKMAADRPAFIAAATAAFAGTLIPVPGGVLIKSGGEIVGAVGISGDTSDNDEAAAFAGIEAAGLEADAG
jgi:uncharacterized protein GlcG (DUF336 family)